MDTETPAVHGLKDTDQSRKRPAASLDGDAATSQPQRRPRGRYTPVACDDCKKRKMKCIRGENKASCERCLANGLACRYTRSQAPDTAQASKNKSESRQYFTLKAELAQLRQDFADLSETVTRLNARVGARHPQDVPIEKPAPKRPQFVTGTTLGFNIGEHSLARMGIPPSEEQPRSRSQSEISEGTSAESGFWSRCTTAEAVRLLHVFKDAVETVYPYVDVDELVPQAHEILEVIRNEEMVQSPERPSGPVDYRDVLVAKLAICTSMILEGQGKAELTAIMKPIEKRVGSMIMAATEIDLKHVQVLMQPGAYYLHNDEDLLAWRMNGIAARAAIEMGLHRKRSLLDNFQDSHSLQKAVRVFWCLYLLDRRYSFGTGLSFVIPENDIDPDLPRPGVEFPYLECMVGYGALCTKIWDAIPPFKFPPSPIPRATVESLDRNVRDWMDSIPPHLKLRHPRERPLPQPDNLFRLRTMLYLRGNHFRILIHQHHLYSAASIAAEPESARLAVDIAKDSVDVLTHLNETSYIYSRQQSAYYYFLASPMSAIFLAVCHAPKTFSEPCRKSFIDAVGLIRGFSGQKGVSCRVWESIRGLLPRLKMLGLNVPDEAQHMDNVAVPGAAVNCGVGPVNFPLANESGPQGMLSSTSRFYGSSFDGRPCSDILQMSDDLMNLFDMFGQYEETPEETNIPNDANNPEENGRGAMPWEGGGYLLFPGYIG